MPIIFRSDYGRKPRTDGQRGFIKITPTRQQFTEADGTDVRLDRVRVFDGLGKLVTSFLRDKMGRRFTDNLSGTEDDLTYLRTLPRRAKK